jgi:hypothetical protein
MFHAKFSDGSPDHTSPHRKGYRFLDVDDAHRLAADEAYEARRQRLHYTNRQRQQDAAGSTPPRIVDTAQLRAKAEQAWEERNARMRNAWRTR